MTTLDLRSVPALLGLVLVLCACSATDGRTRGSRPANDNHRINAEKAMFVHYLEIVTPDVEATCAALEKLHGVSFGEADAGLGNARTAALESGGRIGVRAPMHDAEESVVRPYVLVDDIAAAVSAATASGGEIAVPPMEIPGQGKFAIYFLGGIEHGVWQR